MIPPSLRDALRAIRRRPLVAGAIVLALGLGLGATLALWALVDAVLLARLPVPDADRLIYVVATRVEEGGHYSVPYHNYMTWREADAFAAMTAFRARSVTLSGDDAGERLTTIEAAPGFFDTLGVEPLLGRRFVEGDGDVAVLGHALWQRRFGGQPSVIGESVVLDGEAHTVIGVMPAGHESHFLGYRDLWTPLMVDEAAALREPLRGFSVLGRLRVGVELEVAEQQLEALAERLAEESPATNEGWGVEIHPVQWWIFGDVEEPLLVTLAVSLLVLLAACGTVAILMLAEVAARRRQAAVRKALGARSWWLARGFLVESLLLAAAGGALGLVLAHFGLELTSKLLADHLPRGGTADIDLRTLAVAGVAVAAAAAMSGLAPAWNLSRSPLEALRGRGEGPGGGRLRRLLVAAEAALAVVAVTGAALCLQTLLHLQAVNPGFEPRGLVTLRLELPDGETGTRQATLEGLLDRLEALPGVQRAAASGFGLPLVDNTGTFELYVEGRARPARPDVVVGARAVSEGFLEAMGIPLVAGRFFAPGEGWDTANAVVVNETMARQLWPDQDAVGRWVEWSSGDRGFVVGVVGDVRSTTLTRELGPEAYIAWGRPGRSQALVLRTAGSLELQSIRQLIGDVMPGTAIHGVATGDEIVRNSYGDKGLWTWLLGVFALLVMILGGFGLYGVVAHWVMGRRREIGIRMALGALPAAVLRRVLGQGLLPVAMGSAAGVLLSLAMVRYLENQLYGVAARDPITLGGAALVVALLAALVCAIPARAASRLDPASVIRED